MFKSDLQTYVHLSRYARFNEQENRRETWEETVTRYCYYFTTKFLGIFPADEIFKAIYELDVMPSMRCLQTAGPALDRDHVAGYNCSYIPINHQRCFDEVAYILLCGTGVGFSVERQEISHLPEIAEEFHESDTTIVVSDSKIGWASALRELVSLLFTGKIPKWDLSRIRPSGARLKTFGGRASGPQPLEDTFKFFVHTFKSAAGRKFNSLEVHDLICKIADMVVVGGVRRSALLSLSNLSDERLRHAKTGQWWETQGQRALANNSVAYTEKPDIGVFLKEWTALYESKSGERGIFNRSSAVATAKANGRREFDRQEFGTNPCGEIILRPFGFCNLSEVVVRPTDTLGDLKRKVAIATIIGTFQSTLTGFRYLRPIWRKNAEEERLLGVSLTGIMDHEVLSGRDKWGFDIEAFAGDTVGIRHNLHATLYELKQHAIETNKLWADKLGINPSVAITTVKPSGTVSQLVDSASGIHPRYSPYYVRTVRADNKDPLTTFMVAQGFPWEPDVTKPETTTVFSFPIQSPTESINVSQLTALEQLEHYLVYKQYWAEHNCSVTIYVREGEWLDVGAWVYRNFDNIGGISFLPYTEHSYSQAPYQEITQEEYTNLEGAMPKNVDWTQLKEETDNTTSSQEIACGAVSCELT